METVHSRSLETLDSLSYPPFILSLNTILGQAIKLHSQSSDGDMMTNTCDQSIHETEAGGLLQV